MAMISSTADRPGFAASRTGMLRLAWVAAIAATLLLWLYGNNIAAWAVAYPHGL